MPPEKPIIAPTKARVWTIPTILGLILAVLGAAGIIELRPQLTVSPQEPIEKAQPFSVPFRIDNTGYFPFYVDPVLCFFSKVEVGGLHIGSDLKGEAEWNNFELDRGESKTIIPGWPHESKIPVNADITIIVQVRPFRWFPRSLRRYFRFTGAYVDNWQWLTTAQHDIGKKLDPDRP